MGTDARDIVDEETDLALAPCGADDRKGFQNELSSCHEGDGSTSDRDGYR